MKRFANISGISIASLLMEVVALIFVTLVLICPAPFESSNLSLLLVSPNVDASSVLTSSNSTIIAPNNTTSANASSTTTSSASPSILPTSSSVTNANAMVSTANSTTATPAPTVNPAVATAITQAIPPSTTIKRDLPSDQEIMLYVRQLHPTQYQRTVSNETIATTNSTSKASNSSTVSPTIQAASTILLRIGPLGSCFRTSDNVETCTSAKLQSTFDYTRFEEASIMISDLPAGMTTYPLVLLILVISLLLKVSLGMILISVPSTKLPSSITSTSSTLQTMANWLVCAVAITLAVASGIQRNKMSSAATAFNATNQTRLMDSVPLLAQTGSAFGFVWISTALLAVDFFLKRVAIKRDLATDRAKQQILGEMGKNAALPSHYNPTQPKDVKLNPYGDASSTHNTKRNSGMEYLRNLVRNDKRNTSSSTINKNPNEFAMSTLALDEYIRRHYRGDHKDDLQDIHDSRSILSYANDYRSQAKESPPFNSYHGSLEKEASIMMKQHKYDETMEDLSSSPTQSKISSPAPSYWTDRGRQDSFSQREKERLYMAELRRQRSMRE